MTISKDSAFYSPEERLLALDELERRGSLTPDLAATRWLVEGSAKIPANAIYGIWAILLGAVFGGPLVAGYMLANNFKVFDGNDLRAKKAWRYAVFATIAVVLAALFFPLEIARWIPNLFFSIVLFGAAGIVVHRTQRRDIEAHVAAGKYKFSSGRIVVVCLIGGLATTVAQIILIWVLLLILLLVL